MNPPSVIALIDQPLEKRLNAVAVLFDVESNLGSTSGRAAPFTNNLLSLLIYLQCQDTEPRGAVRDDSGAATRTPTQNSMISYPD